MIAAADRCYTLVELLDRLRMPKRTFNALRRAGKLPFVEELLPRLGKHARYRAEPIDRYFRGEWNRKRTFFKAAAR